MVPFNPEMLLGLVHDLGSRLETCRELVGIHQGWLDDGCMDADTVDGLAHWQRREAALLEALHGLFDLIPEELHPY